jgi:hypothetical protein
MLSFFSFLQISHLHTCFTTLLVTTLKVLSSSCQVLSLQSLKHQWMCLPHFCTTSLSIVLLSLAESCFPAPEGSCCTIQRSHHTTSVHSSDGCNLCKSSGLSLCQVVRTVPATAEAFSAPCYRTGCRFHYSCSLLYLRYFLSAHVLLFVAHFAEAPFFPVIVIDVEVLHSEQATPVTMR